jgi:hypothetical protein
MSASVQVMLLRYAEKAVMMKLLQDCLTLDAVCTAHWHLNLQVRVTNITADRSGLSKNVVANVPLKLFSFGLAQRARIGRSLRVCEYKIHFVVCASHKHSGSPVISAGENFDLYTMTSFEF